MKRVEKGTPGYLDYAHRSRLFMTAIFVLVVAAFLTASAFTGDTVSGLLKILAVLLVLPASNIVVQYIAMFPYHSRDPKIYQELAALAGNCRLITELAVTNSDGPTVSIPYAAIAADRVVVLYERKGKKDVLAKLPGPAELSAYLERRLRLSNVDFPVETVLDETAFRKKLPTLHGALDAAQKEQTEKAVSALLANSF